MPDLHDGKTEMTEDEAIARYGVPPSDADVEEIRKLLADETERCRANAGDEPLLRLYCLMLFSKADMLDAVPIWRAKRANFDAFCGVDVQFVCGSGYAETKAYLAASTDPDAKEALDYLVRCEPDFRNWTPLGHLLNWKRYYGLP